MDQSAWAPHGAAMRAFHQGQRDAAIVVYDDYERDEVPVAYFFREPAEFPAYERLALERCRGRVLDVGAGSGCHSLALQARGLEVTAIEAVPELVQILRDRGVRDVRQSTWADLVARPYDTVLVLMNGFGLAETLAGLPRFLRKMRRLVRPDGQLIADSTDVRVRMDPEAGRTGSLRRADGRYIGELHFQLEFGGRKGPPFAQLYVDQETLGRHADETGWQCEIISPPDEYGHYLARLTRRVRLP
ncbi:MAG TPA: class I SAM-dependent methyltransferase [Gemmatimonadales bacterium]|jgi:SAM-dependent methyltransferase|nr:class I SAM-dependent methyltransferase [Gemmatimonadales bacterium]